MNEVGRERTTMINMYRNKRATFECTDINEK